MISREEVLMGRDSEYPLDQQLEKNLSNLLSALNKFRAEYGKPMYVSSGYRPGKYNAAAGGAEHSSHLVCEACDFHDPKGELDEFCTRNLELLEQCGLYLEDPTYTPGWCHLQIRPTKNRIFKP
jgi:hypothetical protein